MKIIPIKCTASDWLDVGSFTPIQGDLKTKTKEQLKKLQEKIIELGWIAPLFCWKDGDEIYSIDGHGRDYVSMDMVKHGYQFGNDNKLPVIFIFADDKKQAKEYLLAINSSYGKITDEGLYSFANEPGSELNLDAIMPTLELRDISLDFQAGWTPEKEEMNDDYEEPEEIKTDIVYGDIFEIGPHRLMCGITDVEKLTNGEKAQLMLTDPQYGIKMDKGFPESTSNRGVSRQYTDKWDQKRPEKNTFFLLLEKCIDAIIFGGNFFADILPISTHWLVWDKLQTMPTFSDCELAWTNIKRNSVKKYTVEYNGLIGKEKERFHPTQKPVKLFTELIKDYSKENDTILDPFSGSGTTMVASHQLDRKCYAMELEPKYCQVTIDRMIKLDPSLEIKRNGEKYE
jgi:hypothetical protein